jgi:hypothetical protein
MILGFKEVNILEQIKGDALLIKFKNGDIIDSLQSGCIYMNSLSIFRQIEKDSDDDKVGDLIDGLMHINDGYLIVEEPELQVQKLDDVGLQTRYSNDFCYCFWGMNNSNYREHFTDEQKEKLSEMGDWALVILNYNEFMRRVVEAVNKAGYEIYGGFVDYYNPKIDSFNVKKLLSKDGLKYIPLLKRNKYEYQQEFRLVVHAPDVHDEHIEIKIGDISDITKKIKANSILNATILPSEK